jgi:hypothetical protein
MEQPLGGDDTEGLATRAGAAGFDGVGAAGFTGLKASGDDNGDVAGAGDFGLRLQTQI